MPQTTPVAAQSVYLPETAGAVMTDAVPIVGTTTTVAEVETILLEQADTFATINYIYVTDAAGALVGVVSIGELFGTSKQTTMRSVMKTKLYTVTADTDQELAARLAVAHNIKAIPVIDDARRLLGVVTADVILQIIKHETTEDFLRIAGATGDSSAAAALIDASATFHIKQRLPWLLVGLLGGTFAAFVVSSFETILAEQVAIAAFIPLVVYLADAVGGQILIIYIRSLALRPQLNMRSYFAREVSINLVLGVVLAIAIAVISYLWFGSGALSIVLLLSVFATVIAAMVIGLLLPWTFHLLGRDPAIASGPFATVIIDVISLLIYFSVATVLLLSV